MKDTVGQPIHDERAEGVIRARGHSSWSVKAAPGLQQHRLNPWVTVERGIEYHWTPKQREVLWMLVKGYSNARIAENLGVSLDAAKWHVREIMSKLGVDTRDEAAEYWRAYNGLERPRAAARFRPGTAYLHQTADRRVRSAGFFNRTAAKHLT